MPDFFEIRTSAIAGKGAFAIRHIPPGTRLIEYTGERVTHEEADSRYDDAEADGSTHIVLFTVDARTVIDAGVGGNDARFINHSCAPNCQAVIERRRVFIDARRDIAPGEELTYDYEMPREGEDDETARKFWPCHCGAPTCRGTLLLPAVTKPPKRRKATARKKQKKRVSPRTQATSNGKRRKATPLHRGKAKAKASGSRRGRTR